ncbi:hypothetical protein G2W53_006159 [Senna tora]|uniref:Uncharacterized protein n=1 Tax=Senna tora TaxID=362788 RepID=A0A835CG77_9FABA|nr:hypothetical protein G2W53_006159 [Senna tora]
MFKVEDFWMEHEDFRKLVQQQWKNNQGQNIWEQWSENYNNFKSQVSEWSNRNLTNAIEVITPLVSTTMNNELIKNVSMQEVEAAVFGLGASKAPGPDGLNGRQIQDNIVMAHEAFHFILNHYTEASGQMINTMKSGIVFSKGMDRLHQKTSAWQVGNGENINMWFDRWLCSNEKIWPLNNVQLDLKVKNLLKDGERKWDEEKIRHLVDLNTARYILATQINETGPDKVIWPYAIDGNYSVKSGYHCAIKDCLSQEEGTSRSREQDSKLWNSIWKAKVQPKVRNFIWKLCKNAIPVRDNLARRKMKVDNQCPICLKEIETTEHCFIFCEKAKAIWFGSLFQWANPNEANLSIVDWIEDRILFLSNATEDAERFCAYFFNLLWALWKSRNEFCFEGNKEDPINILARVEVLTNEFLACHNANSNRDSNSSVTDINSDVWSPPSVGVVKINVDAAMEIDKCRGALSVVVRDHKGEVLTGSVKRFPCVSVLQAEGLAVKEAVMMCSALDIKEAIIESDCKLVVDFCNDRYKSWQLETILEGTNELLRSNNGIKVNWISRKKNMVADFLAREAIKNTLCCTWVWCPPVRLRALLLKDKYPKLF